MIDLHCHSHYSDGVLSPKELLEKAINAGIKTLALTDHDTVEGVKVLHQENLRMDNPIQVINGIELSTRWKKYDIHILGFQLDIDHPELTVLINQQNRSRIERARQISLCLAGLGIENAFEKATHLAGHERIGRPHFADVLMNEGKVSDRQAAFKRYLGRGKPAYVPTPWISITEAIEGITAAGGQAVLAHPLKYRLTRTKLHELITDFKAAGGIGLEVVSGEMTVTDVQAMAGACLRYELLSSSGSDFHGDTLSRISLGRQRQLPLNCMPIWHKWNGHK